ncbi:MAG: tyrosine recombinase XerC [Balneolales bacterium]
MTRLIEKYKNYLLIERNASKHTIVAYNTDLGQFYKFCQGEIGNPVDIQLIKRITIRVWLGELLEQGMSKTSIARKVAAVRAFFKFCFRRGYIHQNPAHLLLVPKKDKKLPQSASVNDLNAMMDLVDTTTTKGLQELAILELFYSTGMRLSELTNLNINDINLQQNQVLVTGKGNKERIVPFGNTAKKALLNFIDQRHALFGKKTNGDARRALFLSASGKRIYPVAVQRLVKKYLTLCSEVSQKSPHILRHSFATHLLDRGASIRIIKELLGHSSLAATQIYTSVSIEHLKDVYSQAHPRADN